MPSQQSLTACVHSSCSCIRSCVLSSLSFKQGVLFGKVMRRPSPREPRQPTLKRVYICSVDSLTMAP